MGNCFAVEVREQPVQYYDESGQPRHIFVRQRNKPAYRTSDELSLYRPRSRLGIRHDDFQSQHDFRGFGDPQDDRNDQYQRFEPLPPRIPLPPVIHNEPFPNIDPFRNNQPFPNNDPHGSGGIVDLGSHQPYDPNAIVQVIDEPADRVRRPSRSSRGRRQLVVHSSRRSGHNRRYYDDSDDDSWAERNPRIGYADDSWWETYRPGRRRSSRRRSRSRNNGRNYR